MTRRNGIVFRVEKGQGSGLAVVTGGFALMGVVGIGVESFATFWGTVATAVVVGYVLGNRAKLGRCSRCNGRLPSDEGNCPGCDGIIKGTVSRAKDVQAAAAAAAEDDG